MNIIKSIFISFTIWVLAALLNGLLSGTVLAFLSNKYGHWPMTFLMVFIATLVFSLPGILIFWIVWLINWHAALLFRSLLKTGFIISTLSSLFIYILPLGFVKAQLCFVSVCIVVSCITSIMIHHRGIKNISGSPPKHIGFFRCRVKGAIQGNTAKGKKVTRI